MTMKKGFFGTLFMCVVVLTGIMGILELSQRHEDRTPDYQNSKLDLNEIIQLSRICGRTEAELENTASEQQNNRNDVPVSADEKKLEQAVSLFHDNLEQGFDTAGYSSSLDNTFIVYGICVLLLLIVYCNIYLKIIKPFIRLEQYAAEIAKGNLQVMLPYERTNYFGAFTWAFDHMRKEIIKARACEKEAIDNNKTVIATLSHDIKTPIASIRAYAEALDANLDSNQEKRRQYSAVIMKKCDEVTKLTNDLFLHSLSDLNRLRMNLENVRLRELIDEILSGLQSESEDIQVLGTIPDVIVKTDRKRFEQVMENLVNNARKYAEGLITVRAEHMDGKVQIRVQDYGNGIPDEDIPFIFNKFYRGKNCGEQQGSGLGLYIVKYIMVQTGGKVRLKNTEKGLEVLLTLELKS